MCGSGLFLIGFVLELVVLYPAIAGLYALLRARSYLLHTLPMFVISTGYVILHRSVRPPAQTHVYDMFFDASMFQTLLTYCRWAVGALYRAGSRIDSFDCFSDYPRPAERLASTFVSRLVRNHCGPVSCRCETTYPITI